CGMACRASGRSTLRMSGTCTTRGMDSILLDTTAIGCSSPSNNNCIQFTRPPAAPLLPSTLGAPLGPNGSMIMDSFGRYPVETTHDHEMPARPMASTKLHAVSGRTLLNQAAKLHTV